MDAIAAQARTELWILAQTSLKNVRGMNSCLKGKNEILILKHLFGHVLQIIEVIRARDDQVIFARKLVLAVKMLMSNNTCNSTQG